MSLSLSRWRAALVGAAVGLAVAMAVAGQAALASGGRAAPPTAAAKVAHTSDLASSKQAARAQAPASGPGPDQFLAAVARLVRAGTITSAQAQVLDADIRSGSIDPDQLVASGTLTSAQMHAVNDRLVAVKRSLVPAGGGGRDGVKEPQG